MLAMASYIETQIADRRKQLADINRRRIVLESELRAYEDALRHQPAPNAPVASTNGHAQGLLDLTPEQVELTASFNRLSDAWRGVLRTLSTRETFRSRDVFEVAEAAGMETSMPNVRSQLTLLTQRGILRRVSEGDYTVEPVARLLDLLE
jgi:hypothetical protein